MSDEYQMRRERRMFAIRRGSAPIVADLAKAGLAVTSIKDVRRDKKTFRAALFTLLVWLERAGDLDVKKIIVGMLANKWASPEAAVPLIEEFRRVEDPSGLGFRWAIGSALEHVADDSVLNQIVELAKDARFGRAREMVVMALGNMKDEKAIDVLIELLGDSQVVGNSVHALGKLRATTARDRVQRLLTHERAWVRKEAKRALAKIARSPG